MSSRQTRHVSSAEYVVRLPKGTAVAEVTKNLASLGTIEAVAGHAGMFVARLKHPVVDPKTGWEQLRKKLGTEVEISPVFLDDKQTPLYAAGTIHVRFPSPPTDSELRKWLPPGLRVKSQNQYVPEQWALEPEDPANQYLPELLAAVETRGGDDVTVWPETIQQFRRA